MLTWVLSVSITLTVCDELALEDIPSSNKSVTAKRRVRSCDIGGLLAIHNVDLFASVFVILTIAVFASISLL